MDATELRMKLNTLDMKHCYIKWWAERTEFDLILEKLDVNYDEIDESLDIKDDLYCIWVGSTTNRTVANYLNEFINAKHTQAAIKSRISTFRRSISSIVSCNFADEEGTNNFIDKLKVEIIPVEDNNINLEKTVTSWLKDKLYILNIRYNNHELAKDIIENLNKLRNQAEINAYQFFESSNGFDFKIDVEKRNIIYFGAPGTGKSYNLNKDKDKLLENCNDNYERVTFHPDYSYANFVGTYKPVPEDDSITYEYVPGPFMRILKKAIENPNEQFLLIIEEINRANVAAVFGDVFQILDRNKDNESVYPIDASEDIKTYLNQNKIILPENLYIWATMNSADQGVFPMDTAFKRRWDFKYFSINYDEDLIDDTHVIINDKTIYWNDLRKQINDELLSYKLNEDKLMGSFFAFNEFMNKKIPTETFKDIFKNKIIMYLFEDAARSKRNELFSGVGKGKNLTYSQICEEFDKNGIEIFTESIKEKFISDDGE